MKHSIPNCSSMIVKKLPIFLLFALAFAFTSGCMTADRGDRSYVNVAGGLYERQIHSYEEIPDSSIALRRSDVDPGAPISGNRTSLLWGLFTYYDY